jgi:ABC-2 type transport system ATP-binding protein
MISNSLDYALQTVDLTKRYGNNIACDRINLAVRSRTTFGLLGPNGAGKSTLIRILMGITQCDSGQAKILGQQNLRQSDLRKRVGYVP